MSEQRGSIEIEASPEEVWKVIGDPSRLGEWATIHEGFEGEAPSSVDEGTAFTQKISVAGQGFSVDWKATEVSEPSNMVWEGKGPMGSTARTTYELSESGDGAKFVYSMEFDPPGGKLGDAAAGAVEGRSQKEADESLEQLKRVIEGG